MDEQQQSWNDHLTKVRKHLDEQKATYDVVTSENRAEQAESDAKFARSSDAYSAIEEAEYAVLDAILARADVSDAIARSKSTNV